MAVLIDADTEVSNSGTISGASAVFLGLFGDTGGRLVNSGLIQSNDFDDAYQGTRYNNGVFVEGTSQIVNLAGGTISAVSSEGAGVRFLSDGFSSIGGSSLTNYGTITSLQDFGVSVGSPSAIASPVQVLNFGTISGGDGAYSGSDYADVLTNRGLLVGDVLMGDGADTFDTRWGHIEGNVDLGAGNDRYDGRGTTVTGTISGGAGDDTMTGNAALDETFDGGDGIDTLLFTSGARVVIALDGTFANDGAALGDTYTGFERVTGSNTGDDMIRGNAANNILRGLGGNDTIEGAGGNDWLYGSAGDDSVNGGNGNDQIFGQTGTDTLTGGSGNDSFRFDNLAEIGDVITDFHNLVGDNDRFVINAAAFGGGLMAGALAASQFIVRADNLAQDADDRFVFRTTDRTLWFDDDGTGAHTAVMVADLQAGIMLSAADIVLI